MIGIFQSYVIDGERYNIKFNVYFFVLSKESSFPFEFFNIILDKRRELV